MYAGSYMMRIWRQRRWWIAAVALVLSTLVSMAAWVWWRAWHAKEEAETEVRAKSEFAFRIVNVDRAAAAGVDVVTARPGFRDLAVYKDMVAVSARAGLFLYDRNGRLIRAYRAGMELPGAELGPISSGGAAGSNEPELFIATRGAGLLVFDGSRFRQILPDDTRIRRVTAVLVLGSGQVLLGTERQGVLVFDGRRLKAFERRLAGAHITAMAGSEGDLWIGTLQDGVFHYEAGRLDELRDALPDPQVLSVAVAEGAAYVGTPLGVVEFRDSRRERTVAEGFFARAVARRGDVLEVGTEDEGILDVPLDARPEHTRSTGQGSPREAIQRLATVEGEVYAVTANAIFRYDPGFRKWTSALSAGASLMADRNVAALALSGGRLWIGYFDRGLDVADAGLEHAEHHESDTLFCINRIVPDAAHGRTAVATANGLVMFDSGGEPRQVLGRKDGLLADHVTDVAFRDGGMVVATPAGLSFVDRGGVRSLYVFHGLVNNHVYAVATQGAQVVAGTLGGLSVLDNDVVRANYTTANSHLTHNWITAVARLGSDWFVGTYGAGVLRLEASGEWHSFPDLKPGLVVNPNAMAASRDRIYAGTLDDGLLVFDQASGRWIHTDEGLPSRNVTAIAAGNEYVYVGTDNGLVRIAEGTLR